MGHHNRNDKPTDSTAEKTGLSSLFDSGDTADEGFQLYSDDNSSGETVMTPDTDEYTELEKRIVLLDKHTTGLTQYEMAFIVDCSQSTVSRTLQ